MRCPACGAFYEERSARCPECGAIQDGVQLATSTQTQPEPTPIVKETSPQTNQVLKKRRPASGTNPSLIEFPGVNRNALPQWRKELAERVRAVQERRAREAVLEAGGSEPLFSEFEVKTSPMLELLSRTDAPPPNPLVAAALRRIERAHAQPIGSPAYATAVAAVAYDQSSEPEIDLMARDENIPDVKPGRVHNLAVVPNAAIVKVELLVEASEPANSAEITELPRKPRRIIDDRNDPALNYLDSIPTSITLETREYRAAPIFLRVFSALADLIIVGLLSSPFLMLTKLTNLEWRNPRVIGFAVGTFLVVGFLYLTISIAFTGRTLGMKMFSLRVVDARTGLIPTGSQSAGRAFVYMLSLAAAGLALIYTFIDSEKHTAHDRFTRTAVIRV